MFFFFFFYSYCYSITIPVAGEIIRVEFALAIPIGAPAILLNEIIDIPPLVPLKTVKIVSM